MGSNELQQGEIIHNSYHCAQLKKRGFLAQGKLYITNQRLIFNPLIGKSRFTPLKHILGIKVISLAGLLANSIDILTSNGTIRFQSFIFRDAAYNLILRLHLKEKEKLNISSSPTPSAKTSTSSCSTIHEEVEEFLDQNNDKPKTLHPSFTPSSDVNNVDSKSDSYKPRQRRPSIPKQPIQKTYTKTKHQLSHHRLDKFDLTETGELIVLGLLACCLAGNSFLFSLLILGVL